MTFQIVSLFFSLFLSRKTSIMVPNFLLTFTLEFTDIPLKCFCSSNNLKAPKLFKYFETYVSSSESLKHNITTVVIHFLICYQYIGLKLLLLDDMLGHFNFKNTIYKRFATTFVFKFDLDLQFLHIQLSFVQTYINVKILCFFQSLLWVKWIIHERCGSLS